MKNKLNSYLILGVFLTYCALSDDEFIIMYNGIALIAAISAFVKAYFEYRKNKTEEN